MAIQNRRGAYADFDPAKMVPGEMAVITSGDPGSADGRAVYFCVSSGHVKRFASIDELLNYNEEVQEAKEAAESAAQTAAQSQLSADQSMQTAQTAAQTAQNLVDSLGPATQQAIDDINTAAEDAKSDVDTHIETAVRDLVAQTEESELLIQRKTNDILAITTSAETLATQALNTATAADDAVYDFAEEYTQRQQLMQLDIDSKIDRLEVIDNALYAFSGEDVISGPIEGIGGGSGGGGGSGSGNSAQLSVSNASGWNAKTITPGSDCIVTLVWSSIEDEAPTGNGTLKIINNGSTVATMNVAQGTLEINVANYVKSGDNQLRFQLQDVYGNSRTLILNVKLLAVSITSSFDATGTFNSDIPFTYTPNGSLEKTVHFLIDGTERGTQLIKTSGRQQTYIIPRQSHGSHSLEVYFTAESDGMDVESNHLYYDLICTELGNYDPIIAIPYNETTAAQYTSLIIPYMVYNSDSLTSDITLMANGKVVNTLTVDRTRQEWTYRAIEAGTLTLTIVCGDVSKSLILSITETDVDVSAEEQDLALYLSSYGRSNAEADPDTWVSGSVETEFSNFNHLNDGWQKDEDGISVLRVAGDARLSIPYKIFEQDCRTTGKTIEIEFATRDVRDYDVPIISCMQGNRGIELTAQLAVLKSEQSEISMQYKDEEHLRVSFVVEKRSENRLIYVYVDGVLSGGVVYPSDDDFQQTEPVNISIGSNDCAVDLYCIRVYDNNLTQYQILDNWIADTQDGSLMLERYAHNNIFDEYGKIVMDKLPRDLAYLVLEGPELPPAKGEKKIIDGRFVCPFDTSRSFAFTGAQIDVQGTSSQGFPRKNYKIKFKEGFILAGGIVDKYPLTPGAIAVNTFTFKADFASSEGANNTELVRLYEEASPYRTPPQDENVMVRQGIDGFPIFIFWSNGDETVFLGKYNFNNDKGTEELFGFESGDESWEMKNNTSSRVIFKDDDFSGTDWLNDFEGRYPDGNEDPTQLAEMVAWVKSTDGNVEKFKSEFDTWFDKDSSIFYYLFTHQFLMVDSRAKNTFPTKFNAAGKWSWLPYDFDTALGINNEGDLVFGYNLEDTDHIEGGANVFNGQGSVFWNNLAAAFPSEIKTMYQTLRTNGKFSYSYVRQMFDDHQSKWPEGGLNEDARFKYIEPYVNDGINYLAAMQGNKKSQRDWWLYHRFRYMDSKYNLGDDKTDYIYLRGYAKSDITITPYADMYLNVKYGSYLVSQRAERNNAYTMACPIDDLNDTELFIYSASLLSSVGDLSALKVGQANVSSAIKLRSLKLGDNAAGYSNANLRELTLGNNTLLESIDCRNCTNLGTGSMAAIDLSGCTSIEDVLMEGTQITGVYLPNGGVLKTLHLPKTVANLTLRNQKQITDLSITDGGSITTLWLENVTESINPKGLIAALPANSRLRFVGFNYEAESVSEISGYMDIWDRHRGLDESGNTVDKAQISGTFHVSSATGAELAEMHERYPYVTVNADHITSYVYYYSDGALYHTETVYDGANAVYTGTPTKSATAQYTYAFAGWSKTDGGTVDSAAQTAVTADRNLYAVYTATINKYSVYFYNGSTLLQTVSNVPYGGSATYTGSTPTDSSGNPFSGWSPAPTNITGNTTCYAQFQPLIEETIEDDWDTIIGYAEAGTILDHYALGDTKVVDFGGTAGSVAMQLIAVNMDNLADASGKAKTTWLAKQITTTSKRMNPSLASTTDDSGNTVYTVGTGSIGGWPASEMRTYVSGLLENLPANLKTHIKEVAKSYDSYDEAGTYQKEATCGTVNDKLWIPSYNEMFNSSAEVNYTGFFTDNASRKKYKVGASSAYTWWLRSAYGSSGFYYVTGGGYDISNSNYASGVVPGFCI